MKVLPLVGALGWVAALVGLAAASGLAGQAATEPPHFDDGFGLTVISQSAWMDATERTFTFTVRSDQVPAYTVLPGQVSAEHVIMVTLPGSRCGGSRHRIRHYMRRNADTQFMR